MSTVLEKTAEINPFAPPLVTAASAESELLSADRASQQTLQAVHCLYVVADLSYIAVCVSFFTMTCFAIGVSGQLVWACYFFTLSVFWCATVTGLFTARVGVIKTILMALLLLIPLVGTVIFLSAQQDIRKFMISNGYLTGFLGFRRDDVERNAMAKDPDYKPSIYFQHDGRKRKRFISVGEALILLSFFCVAGFIVLF